MLRGLDVSVFQGALGPKEWADIAVTLGCRFAFIKAVEGMDPRPDAQCANNVRGARGAGLAVGGYGVVHPFPTADPVEQAKLHFDVAVDCGLNGVGDLPFACDLEVPDPSHWAAFNCTGPQIRDWTFNYLEASEGLWGMAPLVYSYPDFFKGLGIAADTRFAKYGLWAASYTTKTWPVSGGPLISRPWTSWEFWQWDDHQKLPNGTTVDFSVYNGDDLSLIVKQAPSVASMNPEFVPPDPEEPT